jgi:putative membrane protein
VFPPGPLRAAGFAALWHPELIAATALLGAAYLLTVTRLRPRFAGGIRVPAARQAAFLGGIAALYAAQGSPLELLANRYLLSAHMAQMVLLVFVATPLCLEGLPEWLLRPVLARPALAGLLRRLTRPRTSLPLFIGAFCIFLLPPLTDLGLADPWLYTLEHALLVLAALCLWWPVTSRAPEVPALEVGARLLFLFMIEVFMTLPFALITFAPSPLYPAYADAPRVLGLSPLFDQQLGGIIMRLGSGASFGVLLARTFFGWAAREPARDPDLVLPADRAAPAPALEPQAGGSG